MNEAGREILRKLDPWSPGEFRTWVKKLSESDEFAVQVTALGLLMDEDDEGFSLGKQRALIVYAFETAVEKRNAVKKRRNGI